MIKIHNQETFTQYIELAVKRKELTYIEAIAEFCQDTGVEFTSIPKLITPIIRDKLEAEAIDLKLLKRGRKRRKLPIK
jgi:hypothetical protein